MDEARKILQKIYGYDDFRPGQASIIKAMLDGKDTLGIMPTGGGKSIGYQIPALLKEGTSIVISPLISLMKDQVDALKQLGVPAAYLNSSLSAAQSREVLHNLEAGEYKLLYVAPERLEAEQFSAILERLPIPFVAIDEAHCVSQWGHDFRTSYLRIAPFVKQMNPRPVVAAFTATATEEVRRDIVRQLELRSPEVHVTGFDRPNLTFRVLRGVNREVYVREYVLEHQDQAGIIYTATRKEAETVQQMLEKAGVRCGKYHAGMSDREREKQQHDFLYDQIQVMVATNAFGMGIDKSNVRYVLHWNLPKNMEAYYQEAGRAGRDGERGECILLFQPQDIMMQKYLIEQSVGNPERQANELSKLRKMSDYCHTQQCLRAYILRYFGQLQDDLSEGDAQHVNISEGVSQSGDRTGEGEFSLSREANEQTGVGGGCNNCGNCLDGGEYEDITIEAQKIFSCIKRMNERFGMKLVAQVLKGSANKRVFELKLDRLPTYGIMKDKTEKSILDLIQLLTADGYLALSDGQYPVVRLQQKSVDVLLGKEKVYRRTHQVKRQVEAGEALFNQLRELRKQIAQREGIPPYMVFSDSTLREMAIVQPTRLHELLQIKGVGETKLNKYGEEFLQVIHSIGQKQ